VNILKFISYAIRYAGGDFMALNQTDVEAQLETRFPGFRAKKLVEHEGLSAFILSHQHEVHRSPCYNYGYRIGDDIEHIFRTELLIIPLGGTMSDPYAFVIVRINGYSNYSERYDQDSVSVSCELGTGERMELESHYDYEKYGGQSSHKKNPLAPLLEHMRLMGYNDLTEQQLAGWLGRMRSHFSY
jgi:hypothetical protein